jgi:hypothetical protein
LPIELLAFGNCLTLTLVLPDATAFQLTEVGGIVAASTAQFVIT